MGRLRHRVLTSLTRGADMRLVLLKSSALSLSATLFTLPYFHYLIFIVPDNNRLPTGLGPWGLLSIELFLLFILCLLSAMAGFSFFKKLGLPGFGDWRSAIRAVPFLLITGGAMILLSYLLFDRHFILISPRSYPKDTLYLISIPLKGAFTEEVILRFCLVTIGVGLFRSKHGGILLVSALASFFSLKYFHFIGVTSSIDHLLLNQCILSFSANLLLGYLFVTRGLLHAMILKSIFCMKYMVLSWVIV